MPSTNSRASALAYPKATASRSYQHQMFDHGSAGAIALGVCHGQAPAVVHDNAQDRPEVTLRAGLRLPPKLHTYRGHRVPGLSHCRSARTFFLPVLGRGRMLIPSWVSGLYFPAERIRAARGAFNSVRVPDCRPAHAQSLRDKPAYQVAIAEIHHLSNRLSSSAVSVGIDPNERQLTCRTRTLCSWSKNL